MTVKQFKQWLEQFDDDTIVEVVEHVDMIDRSETRFVTFDGEQYNFIDFTKNVFVDHEHPMYGKKILEIGEL